MSKVALTQMQQQLEEAVLAYSRRVSGILTRLRAFASQMQPNCLALLAAAGVFVACCLSFFTLAVRQTMAAREGERCLTLPCHQESSNSDELYICIRKYKYICMIRLGLCRDWRCTPSLLWEALARRTCVLTRCLAELYHATLSPFLQS